MHAADFKTYLTQVGALYDALQRGKENEDDGGTQIFRKGSKQDEFADILDTGRQGGRGRMSRQASLASLNSLSPLEPPQPKRRVSGGVVKRTAHAVTPLTTIPTVYFDDDFHLENPRTFDVVSERSEVVRPAPGAPDVRKQANGGAAEPRKALATNAILQEKLSWYMDTIEVHLISSISAASTSFFAALGSLRELHTEAAESVERIKKLREELGQLDSEMAVGGLNIVNKRRRRENLQKLGDVVQQLKDVVEGVGQCEALVDQGEVDKALDAVDALERLVAGEAAEEDTGASKLQHLRDLRGATALQGISADMGTLRYRIGRIFESRFLASLVGDLRHHVESVSTEDTLQRWSQASQRSRGAHSRDSSGVPSYLNLTDSLRSELLQYLNGLHRARHTSQASSAFREAVLKEVKSIIRRPLPSSNDDDNDSMMSTSTVGGKRMSQQDKSSILARNLRALDPEEAEELLVKIYIGVGETLRRLGVQVKLLLDVTSSIGEPPGGSGLRSPPRSPNMAALDGRMNGAGGGNALSRLIQEELHQTLDMSTLLGQAVDIAQTQIVKVLKVRSEQSTHQSLTRFLRYFTLNLLFANECEAVSGRGGTALKTVVNGHINDFVHQLGESERQRLAQGMEGDQWVAKDFTERDNVLLARVLESSTQDAEAWQGGSKVWQPYHESEDDVSTNGAPPTTNGNSAKDKTRSAIIDEQAFLLPQSALLGLYGISTFQHLITGIPSLTTEIATSLLSFLSLFNSRCTQLILGAGATRSAGLKNITTKHLALASQALSFISTLIPHVREFIRRKLGPNSGGGADKAAGGSLIAEFDKVRRMFQEHQNSIYDKLVDIMSGRAATHVKAFKLIDWDVPTREEAAGKEGLVSASMETLTKETGTLHKVLSKHLPEGTVGVVMGPVFKSYREQWGKAFEGVVVKTQEGKNRYVFPSTMVEYLYWCLPMRSDTTSRETLR